MRTIKPYCFLLMALTVSGSALGAGYFHSADALEQLRLAYDINDPETRAAYFRGYVTAVADSTHGKAWCAANSLDAETMTRAVSKYLNTHPTKPGEDAVVRVSAALSSSFPCPSK